MFSKHKLKLCLSQSWLYEVWVHSNDSNFSAFFLKSFSREKSTQDEKVSFIKGIVFKATQVALLSFFILKSVWLLIPLKFWYPAMRISLRVNHPLEFFLNCALVDHIYLYFSDTFAYVFWIYFRKDCCPRCFW